MTVVKYFDALVTILNDAVNRGYFQRSPAAMVMRPKVEEKPIVVLTLPEIRQFMEVKAGGEPGRGVKIAILFACFIGLRISDLWNHVWLGILTNYCLPKTFSCNPVISLSPSLLFFHCISRSSLSRHARLVIELRSKGLQVEQQKVYPLYYKGQMAGAYIADLVVEDRIILELKSVQQLNQVMEVQLLNYLWLSHLRIGYLVNFHGTRVEFKRFVV